MQDWNIVYAFIDLFLKFQWVHPNMNFSNTKLERCTNYWEYMICCNSEVPKFIFKVTYTNLTKNACAMDATNVCLNLNYQMNNHSVSYINIIYQVYQQLLT
jgi:hypothetical protein